MKKTAAKGHTTKHTVSKTKHAKTSKHTPAKHPALGPLARKGWVSPAPVHTKAKPATHAKAKALALAPGDVACCAAEALAASLRLQGHAVSDEDVLALYWHTASDPDAGALIEATLEAARRFGLGGVRPAWYMPTAIGETEFRLAGSTPLILGLELPGPHTVLATPEGWWSWGELYCPCEFPDAVVDEAWAVTWTS